VSIVTAQGAAKVLTAMQRGACLHRCFSRTGCTWALSTGGAVSDDVARVVIADIRVEAVNDGLFAGTPQTYRFCED
jgi:hypothetical protein